jgi:hypothetical protein
LPSSLAKGYDSAPLLSTLGGSRIHFEIRAQCHLVEEIYVEIIKMSSPSQNNILKGSMAQAQNKNQKNPTH